MTAGNRLKQGGKVGPHFDAPPTTSKHIIADQKFLAKVFKLKDLSRSGYGSISGYLALQQKYAEFSDKKAARVNHKLMKRTPDLIHENGENKYQPETRVLFQDYAAQGYIGIAADPAYGNDPKHKGKNIPKALLPGVAILGFNANPSFYLKEMVTQGVLKLLQAAIDHEKRQANPPKVAMLNNVFSKIVRGEYTGAMLLTEPQTGSNIGNGMETYATIPDGSDRVKLKGKKKYITGLTTGGIDTVENAIGIVVSATRNQKGEVLVTKDGKTAVSVSLIPLYKLDENGDTIQPREENKITTSHWIHKDGIRKQILQMHDFKGSEGILLGERGNGWNMMFNVMELARLEIGAQAIGHIHTAYTLASDYVTKRGADTVAGVSYAEAFPQVQTKLNLLQAFSQTAAAVLMSAGRNIDLAHPNAGTDVKNCEAKALQSLESSLLKSWLTRHAVILANDAAPLTGSDGFISLPDHPVSPMTQLLADLRPTQFYEGANEMMDKQVVFQQFFMDKEKTKCRIDIFTGQTSRMLNEWDASTKEDVTVQNMIQQMRAATQKLEDATDWLKAEHKALQTGDREAKTNMETASKDYVDLYGRVFMGREAVHIAAYASQQLDKEKHPAKREELEHRMMLAEMIIHKYLGDSCPSLKTMQEAHRFATIGPDTAVQITTNKKALRPKHKKALEAREKTCVVGA